MSGDEIKEVLDTIRDDNTSSRETSDLSRYALSKGVAANLRLTPNFILDYIEVEVDSGRNGLPLPENLAINPMELKFEGTSTPTGQIGSFIKVYYNRLDRASPPLTGLVESGSVAIAFTIKETQKDELEAYLNNELSTNATWVSQFNRAVFSDCTCFPSSCCFYASQYIVKHSTEFYSPNDNQIAMSRFPINNAPLIDMQTPVSIPSGFTLGVAYLDARLAEGKPIVVGVYYRERQERQQVRTTEAQELLNVAQVNLNELNDQIVILGETEVLLRQREILEERVNDAQQNYDRVSQSRPFNSVEPTFHFVVVVGKGYDVERQREFYRYYEVGTSFESNGTHNNNRFYIYDDKLMGSQGFSSRVYIVTEVRQYSQSGNGCP
jgi:hypothetical protein